MEDITKIFIENSIFWVRHVLFLGENSVDRYISDAVGWFI